MTVTAKRLTDLKELSKDMSKRQAMIIADRQAVHGSMDDKYSYQEQEAAWAKLFLLAHYGVPDAQWMRLRDTAQAAFDKFKRVPKNWGTPELANLAKALAKIMELFRRVEEERDVHV